MSLKKSLFSLTGKPMSVFLQLPETRLCQREITGKYAIEIVTKHSQT
jgi:hypothetical protein